MCLAVMVILGGVGASLGDERFRIVGLLHVVCV